MRATRSLPGIELVLDGPSAAERFELPLDREADFVAVSERHAVIGATRAEHLHRPGPGFVPTEVYPSSPSPSFCRGRSTRDIVRLPKADACEISISLSSLSTVRRGPINQARA